MKPSTHEYILRGYPSHPPMIPMIPIAPIARANDRQKFHLKALIDLTDIVEEETKARERETLNKSIDKFAPQLDATIYIYTQSYDIYRVGICIGCGADCRQLPAHNKINPNPNAQSQVPIPIHIPGRVTIPRARTRVTASSNAREKTKQHDILSIDLFEFPLIRDKGATEEGSDRTPSLACSSFFQALTMKI